MPRVAALVAALALSVPLAGCVSVVAAGVPTAIASSEGWRENTTARQSESAWMGAARVEARVWEDRAGGAGHPGKLWVYTLRAPVSPSEDELVPRLRERIESQARAQGIELGRPVGEGERTLLNGLRSSWFAYNGTASSSSGLFSRDAEVRILGEVFACRPARTTVLAVGFAQVTDVRTVGGLVRETDRDGTTWHEVAADPSGTIESQRGSSGLAWNLVCT